MLCITRQLTLLVAVAATAAGLSGCASSPAPKEKTTVTGSYAFWPQFPDEPRIQFIRAYATSEDVAPTKTSGLDKLVFGKETAGAVAISKPYGVAFRAGKVYICDIRAKGITILDLPKKQTRLVGTTGVNHLANPVDIAVAEDGTIYVADNERGAVLVFDSSERYSRVIGHEKFKPVALAIGGDRLYACNMTSQVVEVFDRQTGKQLGQIGTVGDAEGQFRLPLGVDIDPQGNVVVVDMMRCRVQRFTPTGDFIAGVGEMGDFAGSFARPKQVAVDKDGISYVVDASFNNVQMFDDQFRLLMAFGTSGSYPGGMDLPAGICTSEEGLEYFKDLIHPGFEAKRLVFVTNQFGDAKVNVYAMGQIRPGYTAQDLAAAAIAVPSGLGKPDAERLKFAAPATEAPDDPEGGDPAQPGGGGGGDGGGR